MDLVLPDTTYKREIRQLCACMVFFTINDNWGGKKKDKRFPAYHIRLVTRDSGNYFTRETRLVSLSTLDYK